MITGVDILIGGALGGGAIVVDHMFNKAPDPLDPAGGSEHIGGARQGHRMKGNTKKDRLERDVIVVVRMATLLVIGRGESLMDGKALGHLNLKILALEDEIHGQSTSCSNTFIWRFGKCNSMVSWGVGGLGIAGKIGCRKKF